MNEYFYEHKGYYIKPAPSAPQCYVIVTTGKGGKIPDCLAGLYNKKSLAMTDIDNYQESKPIKEKSNGETISTGGSK